MVSTPPRHPFVTLAFALAAVAGCSSTGVTACGGASCDFTDTEWDRVRSLSGLGQPAPDPSNRFVADDYARKAAVEALGQAFFYDTRFSGPATLVDALGRPTGAARAATKGAATNVSCATCHDLARMGIDDTSVPDDVSAGAGWTDVNALSVVNSAYQRLFFSNGRVDSLWALAATVAESPTTMNGDRLQTLYVLNDFYRDQYAEAFGEALPALTPSCQVTPLLDATTGQCTLAPGGFCPGPCVSRLGDGSQANNLGCWPAFPLHGRPGKTPGCQPGSPTEPFGDALDCMDAPAQEIVTRALVNWAKALEAFQRRLVTTDSAFDAFVRNPTTTGISAEARRGARLFVGKAGCFDCHNTALLSDGAFHNIGVPQTGPFVPVESDCPAGNAACDCSATSPNKCLPWGALDGLARLPTSKFLRGSSWSDGGPSLPEASATFALDPALKGAWRTPSLRNVAVTGPYMHDGVYQTLEEVVAHYSNGADPSAVGKPAAELAPLDLTADEQADLVAFLKTLTGSPLKNYLKPTGALGGASACSP
ncbi:MAG TPA: cytochrome c peroxidase [Polyangia bacterium]|nr:cytochrome c peroxidase [Polyangia bacterium]